MNHFRKALVVRAMLVATIVLSGCTSAIQIDLTGIWEGTLTWTSGTATGLNSLIRLDLTQDGSELSGTVTLMGHGSQTFEIDITSGRAKSGTLTLEASGVNDLVTPAVPVSLSLEADYDETQMSGHGTQTIDEGTTYTIDWEATLIWSPTPDE